MARGYTDPEWQQQGQPEASAGTKIKANFTTMYRKVNEVFEPAPKTAQQVFDKWFDTHRQDLSYDVADRKSGKILLSITHANWLLQKKEII